VAMLCATAGGAMPAGRIAAATSPTPPVLAAEDSIRQYSLPDTVLVRSPRLPILEIIRKARDGEKHKYDGIQSLAYTLVTKVAVVFESPKPRTEITETTYRVYHRAPDQWRSIELRKNEFILEADGTRRPKDEKKHKMDVELEADDRRDGRSLTKLPDYLERLDRYDFKILHRSLRPDQVVYEVGFQPKSDFEILPEGRMWVLTKGYQLVREELRFRQLPMPGILKAVDLVTREWQEVDGRWVEKRVTGRAEIGLPKLLRAPKIIEVVVSYHDYVFNPTLDPALFGAAR
jgi:hypothetical protein